MESKPNITKIIIAALLVVAIIIIGIILFTKNNNNEKEQNPIATSSEFNNIKIKDISIEYKSETNITVVKFTLQNTSNNDINKETVNVMLIDKDGTELSGIQNYIEFIEAKGDYEAYAEMLGDFSRATKAELQKPITVQ